MRVYHPIQWVEHIHWHQVLRDRRLWAGVGIVIFVALFTALVIIAAKTGGTTGNYGPMWPSGPFGPVPMR
jgi:hypothetical protein